MAKRKNTKRIDPRYFLDEKMQIPAPVIKKCLALIQAMDDGPSTKGQMTDPGGGGSVYAVDRYGSGPTYAKQTPEEAEIAQADYAELQKEYDRLRCDDTLERAETYGDLEHTPRQKVRTGGSKFYGAEYETIPGKTKLKR